MADRRTAATVAGALQPPPYDMHVSCLVTIDCRNIDGARAAAATSCSLWLNQSVIGWRRASRPPFWLSCNCTQSFCPSSEFLENTNET